MSDKTENRWTVYILECSDGSFYTGYTNDVNKRIVDHNKGKIGAKYTRSRLPVKLIWTEVYTTKLDAMKRERQIKKLDRKVKEALVGLNEAEKVIVQELSRIIRKYKHLGAVKVAELIGKAFEGL